MLQHSIPAMLLLILFVPSASQAQEYCPIKIYNNDQTIGLSVTDPIYNDFVNGNYFLTVISADYYDCLNYTDLFIPVAKTANLSGVIAGADAIKGITFTLPNTMSCMGSTPLNTLQVGAISIVLRKANGTEFLKVNFTDGVADECPYIAFPVTFGSFTLTPLTGPTRNRLNWTTYTESQMGHFSIEKSIDGSTYYKIGEVAATNSPSGSSYQFFDNSPTNKNFYRVVSVDLNCYKQKTNIVWVNCSTCPTTFTPPSVTPDCNLPTPTPYINGPASICGTSRTTYRLNDLKGEAQVTWSVSPANLATLSTVDRIVSLTPTGTSGTITLTAKAVQNTDSTFITKNIILGTPPLTVTTRRTPPDRAGVKIFIANVTKLPGSNSLDYSWYQSGQLVLSGSTAWDIDLFQGDVIPYSVVYNGPCGQSVKNGTATYGAPPRNSLRYSIATNPTRTDITIKREPLTSGLQNNQQPATSGTVDVKVYDMYGNFRKAAKMSSTDTRFTINTLGLPTGLYYVHVIEHGQETTKLKVWVEK